MSGALHLFERVGVELEDMIVDSSTLDVRPIADRILPTDGERSFDEPGWDGVRWSNELTAHVIELKVARPAASLEGLAAEFLKHIARINSELSPLGARLMPTG